MLTRGGLVVVLRYLQCHPLAPKVLYSRQVVSRLQGVLIVSYWASPAGVHPVG